MKYIKRLVLWLFHRWFEVEIRPIHISIDLVNTESIEINRERISRIITKQDYIRALGAYTDAKSGVIVLIGHNLYLLLDKKTKGIDGLKTLIRDYGLINIMEEVVIEGIKHKGYSEYKVVEKE